MVSAEPVSTKTKTTVSLIVAATENEKLKLIIDTDILKGELHWKLKSYINIAKDYICSLQLISKVKIYWHG